MPVDTLAELPFQPYERDTRRFGTGDEDNPFADIFPEGVEVALPPLIGGFVGSDALACLLYYGFDRAAGADGRDRPGDQRRGDGDRWPAHPGGVDRSRTGV